MSTFSNFSTAAGQVQATLALSLTEYLHNYKRYAYDFWENLSPYQYGMVLVAVFVMGYLLMKSAR